MKKSPLVIAGGQTSQLQTGDWIGPKNNSALVAPAVSNDDTQGYEVQSRWTDTVLGKEYVCVDATTGAAVWVETTGGGGGGGHVIEDEGMPVTQRPNMSFEGAGVAVTDFGGKTVVTIPGGGGGGVYGTSFTNANLTAGVLTVIHALANKYDLVQVYDNLDRMIIPTEVVAVDANTLDVDLTGYGVITGTWRVVVGGGVSGSAGNVLWTKFTKAAADFSDAAPDITLFSLPAKTVVQAVIIKHSVPFTGVGVTSYTLQAGIAGNFNKYASAFDVFQAAGDAVKQLSQSMDIESFTGPTNIKLKAVGNAAGAIDAAATAALGVVDVWVQTSTIP